MRDEKYYIDLCVKFMNKHEEYFTIIQIVKSSQDDWRKEWLNHTLRNQIGLDYIISDVLTKYNSIPYKFITDIDSSIVYESVFPYYQKENNINLLVLIKDFFNIKK